MKQNHLGEQDSAGPWRAKTLSTLGGPMPAGQNGAPSKEGVPGKEKHGNIEITCHVSRTESLHCPSTKTVHPTLT